MGRFHGEGHPVLRGPKAMRFRFVEEHIANFPANRLCNVVGVSTRGLRAFRSRPASRRQRSDLVALAHIREQSRLSLGSYGRPRMTEELKEIGLDIGHRRVGRLMRENDISVVRTRKHKVTTDSNHKFNIAPNLLDRNFNADAPNQKWAGDISYVWTQEGWLFLAVILDLHSRRVIGWAVSNRMKRDLAIRALNMAIAFRSPSRLHSPHGSWVARRIQPVVATPSIISCLSNWSSASGGVRHPSVLRGLVFKAWATAFNSSLPC